jgi:hypothetical protein
VGVLIIRVARLAAAVLGIAAMVTALVQSTGSVANFFSFFTIEANILAAVVFILGGLLTSCPRGWPYVRGAVTLYMVITGIVYAGLLSDVDVQLQSPWTNAVLHKILPLLLLADWVFFPPWPRVSAAKALGWLAFPLAYFAYSLVRGPFAHFYPYPFLDPRPHGYDHVIGYAIVLAVGMAVLALLVWRIGHQRRESGAGQDDVEPRLRPRAG